MAVVAGKLNPRLECKAHAVVGTVWLIAESTAEAVLRNSGGAAPSNAPSDPKRPFEL